MKQENRGGKREGSGRKQIVKNPVAISVYLEQEQVNRIDAVPGSRSEFVHVAVEEELKRR